MNTPAITDWLTRHPLTPMEVDCVTAVMLKILDGKCKMEGDSRQAMIRLYDVVKGLPGACLEAEMHATIARFRAQPDETLGERIHQYRVLAESKIPRPTMKGFKARLRESGFFGHELATLDEEAE